MKTLFRSTTLLAALLASTTAVSQTPPAHPWQRLNFPSLQEVRETWRTPPPEYGPEPYYGLNGHVTLDDVRRDLDTMRTLGFHAVTVQYGYGSEIAYLSPEYFTFFRAFVQEARQRNMRVWIVDDAGYPSGFAGGKFTTEHPEMRMQALTVTHRQELSGGQTFSAVDLGSAVAVTALATDGRALQIPVTSGTANWQAPEGRWTVNVVEHVFRTSPTRSDTNPKRVKDGSQSLQDYLDPAATAQFLAFTHEAYKKAVGDEFGKTILGFRGDEPDYSISGLPWTPAFFATFQKKKAYDVRPFLAALLQPKGATLTPQQRLVKADFYDVFADMFRDGFFKPQADWCAANGLEYQVHLNHEELELDLTQSEGDFFRDMRFVQVPGIDTIWHQIWTDTVSDFPRLASSAAHVYGHPRAFTESFAAYRPAPDITMARYILNEQFVRGVNLVETMYFPASVAGKGGPGALMKDPGFPRLMNYSARLSYVMSQGHPAAEVALLLPSSSLWTGDASTDDTFVSAERLLSEHQVDFDIVDEDAIARLMPLDHGAFVSASGNRYRTVIVPSADLLTAPELAQLAAFSRAGGKTVFLGHRPTSLADTNYLHSRTLTGNQTSWAVLVPGDLPRVPTPPAQPPAEPPASMQVPPGYWQAVQAQLPASFAVAAPFSTALRIAHRELRDASVLLLFNESNTAQTSQLTVNRPHARTAELWNPDTGERTSIPSRQSKGQLTLDLHLDAFESRLLIIQ